ncbi:MAG: hypothetical protein EOM87_08350, partial [Clostridia bacterium]|nr:hypothetical protein [Clostridia bacterium]
MIDEIALACKESNQQVPETIGETMQCIYNSLSLDYRNTLKTLESLTGKVYTSLNIVGGGSQDTYLNQRTADAAGINVIKFKYLATCIGSGLTGLAGIFCVMEFKSGAWSTTDISSIKAFGWLAVALVIFAMWKPLNLIWGSLVFGIFYWAYQYLLKISTDLTQMLPYIVTIVVLIIVSFRNKKENQGPASLGMSYFREDR